MRNLFMDTIREYNLLPVISDNKDFFGKNLKGVYELNSGFGIADVVFYNLSTGDIKTRKKNNVNPINDFDLIKVLTAINGLNKEKISLTFLRENFVKTKQKKDYIISYLVENGFLIPENNEHTEFKIGRNYTIGLNEVIAIEAKLSNWQRGLYQAYRYKQFSNKSFLALYSKYIHRALAHKEEFIRANVGLIEVKSDSIQIHIEPMRKNISKNIYSALVYERLLGATKNTSPRFQKLTTTFFA